MTPKTHLTLTLLAALLLATLPTLAQDTLTQEGIASYYGRKFHGRRTANGERFDNTLLTCAHRTLPFGTRLRVTNLTNGRSTTVRVNDRGPFGHGRIIDVSYAAAELLGMVRDGVCRVRIEVVPDDIDRWLATRPFLIWDTNGCVPDSSPYAHSFALPHPTPIPTDRLQTPPTPLTKAQPKRKRRWLLF